MLEKKLQFSEKEREQLEEAFKKCELTDETREQIDDCLALCILDDMEGGKINDKILSKWTFRMLMDVYNVKAVELYQYAMKETNNTKNTSNDDEIRHMRSKREKRKPDSIFSELLIKFCRKERKAHLQYKRISGMQMIRAKHFMQDNGIYHFEDENNVEDIQDYQADILNSVLTYEQVSILDNYSWLFFQFSPIMWITILRVETATEVQRQRIREKFVDKSLKMKKENPELIKNLENFRWENTISCKEEKMRKIYNITSKIRVTEDVFEMYLMIYAMLTKEDWELVCMIILNQCSPDIKYNFSTYTNRKLEECFAD